MSSSPLPVPISARPLDAVGPLRWLGEAARWLEHSMVVCLARHIEPGNDLPRLERERRRRLILCRSDVPVWQFWRRWRLVVVGADSAFWAFAQDRRAVTLERV